MTFRTKSNKSIIVSLIVLFILLTGFGLLVSKSASFSFSNNKEDVLGEVVSAPVVNKTENEVVAEDQAKEEEKSEETQVPTQSQGADENKPSTQATTPEETCTPILKAKFVRDPAYAHYTEKDFFGLGDNVYSLKGSHDGTCLNNLNYEWSVGNSTISRRIVSTTNKPEFTGLPENSYDIYFKVIADGITSEIKTWGFWSGPQTTPVIPPSENNPPVIIITSPADYATILKVNTRLGPTIELNLQATSNDVEDGDLSSMISWSLEGDAFQWVVGRGSVLNTTFSISDSACDDQSFKLIVDVMDSGRKVTRHTINILSPNNVCLNNL